MFQELVQQTVVQVVTSFTKEKDVVPSGILTLDGLNYFGRTM